MDKKAHEALERIRKDVTLTTSDMENQDAAEFFNELADWAYATGPAFIDKFQLFFLWNSRFSGVCHDVVLHNCSCCSKIV